MLDSDPIGLRRRCYCGQNNGPVLRVVDGGGLLIRTRKRIVGSNPTRFSNACASGTGARPPKLRYGCSTHPASANAAVAQSVERVPGKDEVIGSIPVGSTNSA